MGDKGKKDQSKKQKQKAAKQAAVDKKKKEKNEKNKFLPQRTCLEYLIYLSHLYTKGNTYNRKDDYCNG